MELLETLKAHDEEQKVSSVKDEQQKRMEEIEAFAVRVDEFHRNKLERLLRILELLLTKNGYEFDREWWIENGDELDYKEFIEAVLLRENTGLKKKDEDGKEKSTGPG